MVNRLPTEFAALERHVDAWVLPDSRARSAKRLATPYAEIEAFYADMLAQAPRALAHLSNFRLGELGPTEENLLKLMLSLAEIGPAVEWYGQPAVVDGFPAQRFPLVEQMPDNALQE